MDCFVKQEWSSGKLRDSHSTLYSGHRTFSTQPDTPPSIRRGSSFGNKKSSTPLFIGVGERAVS